MTATELNERTNAYGTKNFAQITMALGRNYPDLPAPSSVHVFRHPGKVSPVWKSTPFAMRPAVQPQKMVVVGGNLIPGGSHSFKKSTGKVIVIGGCLVGCEMALDYAQEGKRVTVVEALPKILSAGIPSPIPNGQMIPDLFEYLYVNGPERHKLAAGFIVIAAGFRPAPSMAQELTGCGASFAARALASVASHRYRAAETGAYSSFPLSFGRLSFSCLNPQSMI